MELTQHTTQQRAEEYHLMHQSQVLESFLVSQSWALVDSKQVLRVLVCVLRLKPGPGLLQASIS